MQAQLIEALFTLSRLMKENMTYSSKLLEVSLLQLQVLIYIKKNPSLQMSEIATKFSIELPSATSLVTKLVSMELVSRKSDKKDKRVVRVSLTKKGENLLSDAMKERSKKMNDTLGHLSEEDKKTLLEIVKRLTIKLEELHEK